MSDAPANERASLAYLRTPAAIRAQAGRIFAAAEAGKTAHFALDLRHLPRLAGLVLDMTRQAYPALDVPFHSRWRHFDAPRLAWLEGALSGLSPAEVARRKIELAVTSVLLDAGTGAAWRYRDPRGSGPLAASEGLAAASFELFAAGTFARDPKDPLRADGAALASISTAVLAGGLQVSKDNPLVGLEGRAQLLSRLGTLVCTRTDVFGTTAPRLGNLYDALMARAKGGSLPATEILALLLEALGPIWPGRLTMGGASLGDAWPHPSLPVNDLGAGLVPFHKLSQWLTYSLLEPLAAAGLVVTGLNDLTGLAEYRNGGLFLDGGVLVPKDPGLLTATHPPTSTPIVEWRALTIVLLDRLADSVRARVGMDASELPLAKVLQGGTWAAGRRLAREKRSDGSQPLKLASDGTVF